MCALDINDAAVLVCGVAALQKRSLARRAEFGGGVCFMERVGISFGTPDKEHITRIAVHDSLLQVQYSGTVCIHTHRAAAWGP